VHQHGHGRAIAVICQADSCQMRSTSKRSNSRQSGARGRSGENHEARAPMVKFPSGTAFESVGVVPHPSVAETRRACKVVLLHKDCPQQSIAHQSPTDSVPAQRALVCVLIASTCPLPSALPRMTKSLLNAQQPVLSSTKPHVCGGLKYVVPSMAEKLAMIENGQAGAVWIRA
jgi:hypothetical protein